MRESAGNADAEVAENSNEEIAMRPKKEKNVRSRLQATHWITTSDPGASSSLHRSSCICAVGVKIWYCVACGDSLLTDSEYFPLQEWEDYCLKIQSPSIADCERKS